MAKKEEETKETKPFEAFNVLDIDPNKSVFGDDSGMVFTDQPEKVEKPVDLTDEELKAKAEADEKIKQEAELKAKEVKEKTKKSDKETKPLKDEKAEEEELEEEVVENKPDNGESSIYKVFAEQLSEKGLIIYDPEKFEDSEEGLENAVKDTIQNGISQFMEELPEEFKQMLDFHQAGGDIRQFSKVFFEGVDWSKTDISEEAGQKAVIREALKRSGEIDEAINEMIEEWSDLGSLEKHAKRNLSKLEKMDEEHKQNMLRAQKEADEKARIEAQKEWDKFKNDLYNKEDIKGFKLTPKVKDEMWKFMTVADKKTGLTALQKHNLENKDAQFLYTYLAMNDWDLEKLKKTVKTEVSSALSNKLKNVTDTRQKIAGGRQDSFTTEKASKGFSAFRTALNANV